MKVHTTPAPAKTRTTNELPAPECRSLSPLGERLGEGFRAHCQYPQLSPKVRWPARPRPRPNQPGGLANQIHRVIDPQRAKHAQPTRGPGARAFQTPQHSSFIRRRLLGSEASSEHSLKSCHSFLYPCCPFIWHCNPLARICGPFS